MYHVSVCLGWEGGIHPTTIVFPSIFSFHHFSRLRFCFSSARYSLYPFPRTLYDSSTFFPSYLDSLPPGTVLEYGLNFSPEPATTLLRPVSGSARSQQM